MYKFIKTHDKDFGVADVVMTIKNNEVTLDQLQDEFEGFLRACGFYLPIGDDGADYCISKKDKK